MWVGEVVVKGLLKQRKDLTQLLEIAIQQIEVLDKSSLPAILQEWKDKNALHS